MPIKTYLFRLERMHTLIKRRSTGNPDQFAEKLSLSRSMLMIYLSEMKELGAPIAYDAFSETYFYTERVVFSPYFYKELDERKMEKLRAGSFFSKDFSIPTILDSGPPPLNCF